MPDHELFLEAILRVSTQPPQGRRSLGGRQIKTKTLVFARNEAQGRGRNSKVDLLSLAGVATRNVAVPLGLGCDVVFPWLWCREPTPRLP
jgi:hypothetical protein